MNTIQLVILKNHNNEHYNRVMKKSVQTMLGLYSKSLMLISFPSNELNGCTYSHIKYFGKYQKSTQDYACEY